MARTLVVTNRKGGSGKTATAVNLASELAARGYRVLLIDLDTQSHCALGLGVKLAKETPTVHGFFAGNHNLATTIQQTEWHNLDLIPANPLFEHGSGNKDELLLRNTLINEEILQRYDILILDTPPSLDSLLLNALYSADRVLVPFLPHFLAGEGVKQLTRVLFRVGSNRTTEQSPMLVAFVPVMLDNRIGHHKKIIGGISSQFGALRLLPGIRNDIRVAESFSAGCPLRIHSPKSRAAQDYNVLTDAVLELIKKPLT
jgi:chromosome partitioning protein